MAAAVGIFPPLLLLPVWLLIAAVAGAAHADGPMELRTTTRPPEELLCFVGSILHEEKKPLFSGKSDKKIECSENTTKSHPILIILDHIPWAPSVARRLN